MHVAYHTARQWAKAEGVQIMDADGWRRNDGVDLDTPITYNDFHERLAVSSIIAPVAAPSSVAPVTKARFAPVVLSREALVVKHQLQQQYISEGGGLFGGELVARTGLSVGACAGGLAEIMVALPKSIKASRSLARAGLSDLAGDSGALLHYLYEWDGAGVPTVAQANTVYLSGPISAIRAVEARRRFNAVARWMRAECWVRAVLNPMDIDPGCLPNPAACETRDPDTHWNHCRRADLIAMLDRSFDTIVMLPGFEESRGARLELEVASSLGYTVVPLSKHSLNRILLGYGSDGRGLV